MLIPRTCGTSAAGRPLYHFKEISYSTGVKPSTLRPLWNRVMTCGKSGAAAAAGKDARHRRRRQIQGE